MKSLGKREVHDVSFYSSRQSAKEFLKLVFLPPHPLLPNRKRKRKTRSLRPRRKPRNLSLNLKLRKKTLLLTSLADCFEQLFKKIITEISIQTVVSEHIMHRLPQPNLQPLRKHRVLLPHPRVLQLRSSQLSFQIIESKLFLTKIKYLLTCICFSSSRFPLSYSESPTIFSICSRL